jgi:hypothetical protein
MSILKLFDRAPSKAMPTPDEITLGRMAIRLSYLASEGTLSRNGKVVTYDAEGEESAVEFINSVVQIMEVGRR